MAPGICYIKKEFLLPDPKEEVAIKNNKRKHPVENVNIVKEDAEEKVQNNEANKYQKTGKKDRKRGQNKNRPVYSDDRSLHLCNTLVNGPTEEKCTHPNCRYVHDLKTYLASKGRDLANECPVFNAKGFCRRGVTCRFATAHLDAEGKNLRASIYDAAKPPTTCNGITSDLQVRLRKREFDFTKSKSLLSSFEKQREEKKINEKLATEETASLTENSITEIAKETSPKGKTSSARAHITEKPMGAAVDNDSTDGREAIRKPQINFSDKILLSPLTTVGNLPFRRICKEFGADITCGEMACAVPLVKGITQEWALTKRHESEDIFGVQLCGNNPTIISQAAQLLQETAKVDFLDLNIGCPIDLIYQQGGGSALMRRTNILELTVQTCSSLSPQIPFTVKMRTGVYADKSVAHDLAPMVEEWGAAAVTIHGRSREQRYTKNANWQYIEECASKVKHIPVIGNGDILNFLDYNEKRKIAPHVSSVMIGRGALIKPWIFKEIREQKHWDPTSAERFDIMRRFVNYGLEHWGADTKGVENTRRFLLEWQSFLYRYIPYDLLIYPPQKINQRPQKFRGRDEMETLMSSTNSADWVKLSETLLGPVPDGFTFVPKHKANSFAG